MNRKRKSILSILSILFGTTFMFTSLLTTAPATSTAPSHPFKVFIYNDEYHSIPEAAQILSPFLADRFALHAAVTAHREGRAVIGEFAEEAAATGLRERIQAKGLTVAVETPSV